MNNQPGDPRSHCSANDVRFNGSSRPCRVLRLGMNRCMHESLQITFTFAGNELRLHALWLVIHGGFRLIPSSSMRAACVHATLLNRQPSGTILLVGPEVRSDASLQEHE